LHIKRFTSQSRKIMRLIQATSAAHQRHVSELDYPDLVKDARRSCRRSPSGNGGARARLVLVPDAHQCLTAHENVIDGLVVTFADITKVKKSEVLLATARGRCA